MAYSDVAAPHLGLRQARSLSRRLNDPLLYVHVFVLLLLGFLIVYPAAILIDKAITDNAGNLSLIWFSQAYGNARNLQAILNTVVISAATALVAIIAGTFLAWAVVRTDMPARRIIELASIVPFISTPFIGALAWILLGSPQTGLINQAWRALGGSGALVNIYSLSGIIFVESLYEMPFVFLIVSAALRSMDPTLEEASLASGAGTTRTTLRITLPLVLPAILASGLLVFVLAAEQFGVPAVLGAPARIRVLTTSILESQASYPARTGLAAALSVTLLIIALGGLWLQRYLLGSRSYQTIGGKSAHPRRVRLGPARWWVFAACVLYLIFAALLPYGTIFLSSIRTLWTADLRWEQVTLQNYAWVLFQYPITQRAVINSLVLATGGATLTIVLCALISFLTLRTRLPGRRLLEYLTMLPMGFPGIVLAFGLLHAWIRPPFVLYGTIWIILIAYMTRYIPVGVRSTSATLVQIHPELEEASLSSGANWFQTFKNITLPLLKPGLVAGWVLLFVAFTRELSASVLLYSPTHEVLSVAIYDLYQQGEFRALSALTCVQIAIALLMLVLAKWLTSLDTTEKATRGMYEHA